jgi:hypothetical protein
MAKKKRELDRLNNAEHMLDKISKHPVSRPSRYTQYDLEEIHDFRDWFRVSQRVQEPDCIRNVLYYGYQPLYDLLIDDGVNGEARTAAIQSLDRLISLSTDYLVGYYSGEPDPALFRKGVREIGTTLNSLDGARYKKKTRNIDYNGIYPDQIQAFIKKYIEYSLNGKIALPETVLGCACGSSEVVMPFAGMIGANLGFIRRSHRRGDDHPKIVQEHINSIKDYVKGKNVVCVEDYVCSGESLSRVMETTARWKPASMVGASINGPDNSPYNLKYAVQEWKFCMYDQKR